MNAGVSDTLYDLYLQALLNRQEKPYQALRMSFLTGMKEDRFFDPEVPEVARIGLRRWNLK